MLIQKWCVAWHRGTWNAYTLPTLGSLGYSSPLQCVWVALFQVNSHVRWQGPVPYLEAAYGKQTDAPLWLSYLKSCRRSWWGKSLARRCSVAGKPWAVRPNIGTAALQIKDDPWSAIKCRMGTAQSSASVSGFLTTAPLWPFTCRNLRQQWPKYLKLVFCLA